MLKDINITELENIVKTNPSNLFILEGKNMKTRAELFSEITKKLYFPDYFGNNWNALDDCLQDLDWIHAYSIKIIVTNFDKILLEKIIFDAKLVTSKAALNTSHPVSIAFPSGSI